MTHLIPFFQRLNYLFFSLLFFYSPLQAQTPFPEDGDLFNSGVLPRIDIIIAQDSLNEMLAPGNEESNYEYIANFIFDNGETKDTVENVGFRLRGNTSRYADKKSFKISFNTHIQGQKFQGVEKLNLNGEHNDPTIARAKISWDMLRWLKVPAPRSNHVALYINDEYFGLYINVEHIDDEFVDLRFGNDGGNLYKCLYPADLVYLGDDPELYKQDIFGRRPYDLRTNEEIDDYSDLANFIDVLNNTNIEYLPCELDQVFNVDSYLRAMVYDILSGNWDGPIYNKNNFYLYFNTFSQKFEYIPYDLDNTLGIDWLNKDWGTRNIYEWGHSEPRPIYDRLMQVEEYRNRFSYYMNKAIQEFFNETVLFPYLDELKNIIDPGVLNDPFHSLDYGYSFEDYETAWETALGGHVDYGLKPFISTRSESTVSQLDLQDISPIISAIQNNSPKIEDPLQITCTLEDDSGISSIRICFQIDSQSNITCVDMLDDGLNNDEEAGDGIYGIILPPLGAPHTFSYYIEATDDSGQMARNPNCVYRQIIVGSSDIPLYINEFMASNETTVADEAGEYDDWFELYNGGTESINLSGLYLSDKLDNPGKWPMPDETIAPGEFLLIWADEDQEQGIWHTNFKLSASGESIGIYEEDNGNFLTVDEYIFGEQGTDVAVGRLPNGTGPFQILNPTPGASNEPVATNDILLKKGLLEVFPNPTSGIVQIKADCQTCQLEIVNSLGQRLHSQDFDSQMVWHSKPEPGVYFVLLWEKGLLIDQQRIVRQ